MARADQSEILFRIIIEQPVIGVLHSLQGKDDLPLDAKFSREGELLSFAFPVRVAPGPKFFGEQVKRDGPERRFVYIRVGQSAGDLSSPWSRRMKIHIQDIDTGLLECAAQSGNAIEATIIGTAKDGTPACASVRPTAWRIVDR